VLHHQALLLAAQVVTVLLRLFLVAAQRMLVVAAVDQTPTLRHKPLVAQAAVEMAVKVRLLAAQARPTRAAVVVDGLEALTLATQAAPASSSSSTR
jgi:hypothetical protein